MLPLSIDVLSAGRSASLVRQVRSPRGWAFDTAILNAHVRARGGFQPGFMAVLTVMRSGEGTICGSPLDEGVVMTLPSGSEITASIRPGVAYCASVLPVSAWDGIVAAAAGADSGGLAASPRAVRLSPPQTRAVRGHLAGFLAQPQIPAGHAGASPFPPVMEDYLSILAEAWIGNEAVERGLDRSLRTRLRQARRAGDFIEAHLGEELSVTRLCREVGASRRQLEYAFRTTFGVGPGEYVRLTRLNESRRRLLSARQNGGSVTAIAMDVGFTHLGRFAESYRLLFGETPRRTMLAGA